MVALCGVLAACHSHAPTAGGPASSSPIATNATTTAAETTTPTMAGSTAPTTNASQGVPSPTAAPVTSSTLGVSPRSTLPPLPNGITGGIPVDKIPPLNIADSVLTGPESGAILVQSCHVVSCSSRVDLTTDGGRTWRVGPPLGAAWDGRLGPGHPLAPDSITALDATHLYAYSASYYGRASWWTADGGRTWKQLGLSSGGFDLSPGVHDVVEVPRPERLGNQGIGRFVVIRKDGTLVPRSQFPVGKASGLGRIARTTTAVYVAAGTGYGDSWLMKSFDEGLSWTRLPGPTCGPAAPAPLLVPDGRTLLTQCFRGGVLLRSYDGGIRWTAGGRLADNYALAAATAEVLWAVGNGAQLPTTHLLIRSVDGGSTWTPIVVKGLTDETQIVGLRARGRSAWFAAYDLGRPAGQDTLTVTDDAGEHWRTVRLPH
jgi:photosystem II stability/assembly factor-like uncharacterized protein